MVAINFGMDGAITKALAMPTFGEQVKAMVEIIKVWRQAPKDDPRIVQWMKDNKDNLNGLIPPGL